MEKHNFTQKNMYKKNATTLSNQVFGNIFINTRSYIQLYILRISSSNSDNKDNCQLLYF